MENAGQRIRKSGFLQSEIEAAFSELIHTRWSIVEPSWNPAIDVYETDEAYLIEADLPGIDSSHVQMQPQERSVTICGTRKVLLSFNKGRTLVTERAKGCFRRRIELPGPVDTRKAKARFIDGVYEIILPKKSL